MTVNERQFRNFLIAEVEVGGFRMKTNARPKEEEILHGIQGKLF